MENAAIPQLCLWSERKPGLQIVVPGMSGMFPHKGQEGLVRAGPAVPIETQLIWCCTSPPHSAASHRPKTSRARGRPKRSAQCLRVEEVTKSLGTFKSHNTHLPSSCLGPSPRAARGKPWQSPGCGCCFASSRRLSSEPGLLPRYQTRYNTVMCCLQLRLRMPQR